MKRLTKGFTLLELIIAVVILAVLATIAIPTFAADISNSKTAVAKESAAAIARDAQGMSDSSSTNGVFADPNSFIPNAVSETTGVTSYASNTAGNWSFEGSSGGYACLSLPSTPNNAPFTVTGGAC